MVSLFFSYSHTDEEYRNRLEKHLAPLKREGLISGWHDRKIHAGGHLHDEISQHVEHDQVILLLVSADFLASDYCQDREMATALERHKRKEAIIIPIIVHPCDWKNTPLGELRVTPRDGKPISKHPHHDDAYLEIVTDIREAIPKVDHQPQRTQSIPITPTPSVSQRTPIRSSNLRIRQDFTDHDKDVFLDSTFEFISNYFESSLVELQSRNPGTEIRFKRGVREFTAALYRKGSKQSACKVWLSNSSHFSEGIAFSSNEAGTGYNEMLSVTEDGQSLGLKPQMGGYMILRDNYLTQEGGGEHLWSMFIQPLQRG
jgi:TIR domain